MANACVVERAAATSRKDRSLSALRDRAQPCPTGTGYGSTRAGGHGPELGPAIRGVDVVVCPLSPVPAARVPEDVHSVERRLARTIHGDGRDQPYLNQIMWNIVVGTAALPSTVAPVRPTAVGLPVGAQEVG